MFVYLIEQKKLFNRLNRKSRSVGLNGKSCLEPKQKILFRRLNRKSWSDWHGRIQITEKIAAKA
jgi:citrate lyase beta subunit